MDEQRFVNLLESVLEPDTDKVKSATAQLRKEFYSQPAALTVLLKILTSHDSSPLRQLAAVESRSLVPKHWSSLDAGQKAQIREVLLRTTINEQAALVRHSSARVISAVAKIDLDEGEWADLPAFLHRAATSTNASEREVGVYILYTLLEAMGDGFVDKLSRLLTLFSNTIKDAESAEVRVNTMLALSKIAMVLDPEEDPESLAALQDLIPDMVQVLKQAVDAGDEDRSMQAFEVFNSMLGVDSQILSKHFKDLAVFMIELASSKHLADESRTQALSYLMQCVKYRRLKVQGLKLGEPLTVMALPIVTELGEFQNDEDDFTPARSALGLLDIMAQCLPPSQVIVPLLHAMRPFVNSKDPDERRAAILSLGFCVEGAPDFISTQMGEIYPLVLRFLDDPEIRVRQAALHAVARLADDLAEDLGKEHVSLLPALLKNLDSVATLTGNKKEDETRLNIIKASCAALDSVFEGIEEDAAAKYIHDLLPRLSRMFEHDDIKVKGAAASAIGTIAAAAGKAFEPYFPATMAAMGPFMTKKESEDELNLRAVVCDAVGSMAEAVGPATFQPYVQPLMQASEEALHLGHPRIRETSFILWSTLSKVYEEDFSVFLGGVVKALFESLKQEESEIEVELGEDAQELLGKEITIAGRKIKVSAAENDGAVALHKSKAGGDDDDDDDVDFDNMDSDDDDDAWDELTGVTAISLEKEIALDVIADVICHTRKTYIPYLEKTVETCLGLVEHPFEGVRRGAIGALWRTYAMVWDLSEDGQMEKWQPGLPLKVQPTQDLRKLGGAVTTATLGLWEEEVDRSVVTDINRNIAAVLKNCGPSILTNADAADKITSIVLAIIRKQHPCQQDPEEEEDFEELGETSEYDWLVIDTALDVVAGLAHALGPTFGQVWKVFEKSVLKYASSSESTERSTAVGVIAECISKLEDAVTPYTKTFLSLLLHRLTDPDSEAKSNAAYGIGLLCEKSTSTNEILREYPTILSKLEPLFQQTKARLTDNAAGCLSRMLLAHPDSIPSDTVVPVLVSKLPLTEDYEENAPVWKAIVSLYQGNNGAIQRETENLIPALTQVLSPPTEQLSDETRAEVVELVKYIHNHQKALIESNELLLAVSQGR
ncbi:MAG: hypothetical protein M1825_005531 [Sarcosagium campestre]|nr:MAG: hypothetical protein M1825_005531 [Sarcosagium campestre]